MPCSPLHLASSMPDVRYTLFHCEEDRAVSFRHHALPFVQAMQPGHQLVFHRVPGHGHCDLPPEMQLQYQGYIQSAFA